MFAILSLPRHQTVWRVSLAVIAAVLGYSTSAYSIQPPQADEPLPKLTRPFHEPRLLVAPDLDHTVQLDTARAIPGATSFLQQHGGRWEMRRDRRSDRPNLIQGSGIALIPGKGNTLHPSDVGVQATSQIDLSFVEGRLREFMARNPTLLGSDGLDFVLDPDNSAPFGEGNTHWFIALAQHVDGVPVDGAYLFFRLAHGNIIQFGSERVAPVHIHPQPASRRDNAFDLAWQELAFPQGTRLESVLEAGELRILPMAGPGEQPAMRYGGSPGEGYEHVLAWRFVFRVNDDPTTYEVLADAQRNRIIEVRDLNANLDAVITGGIYPMTNTDPEITVPMPFLAVSNGGAKVTDALGIYDYSGGTATTALDGRYIRINDNCGAIAMSGTGNIDLGMSGGTDCTTPGVGGPGNTHAARTGFYHLTRINRKAARFHPTNNWLAGKLTAYMNVNDTCNAYWDGTAVTFFKSGAGCSNTGELAAVFLHEWGHGMDTNTGGVANENASGEAVGDTFAFLETGDACIGENFRPGVPCHNCSSGCTGVRDVSVFSTLGAQTTARPSTVLDPEGMDCGQWSCPYYRNGFPYFGPMGFQGHCESQIASSANWDLTQALVDRHGEDGWDEMDRIWYGSLIPSKSAYRVASGGTCNVDAQVDGCAATNWYTVFLAVDDDDGDLSNGTPNACRIWDAFDAHGIACGARPPCSIDTSDFRINLPSAHAMCAPGNSPVTIGIGSQMGFANPVSLATGPLPAGIGAQFTPNPVLPGSESTMMLTATAQAGAGVHNIPVLATAAASPGHEAMLQLTLSTQIPGIPSALSPADGAVDTPQQPLFKWTADPSAIEYLVEVARDAAFANVVASALVSGTQWTPEDALLPRTTHYWRVTARSGCGDSAPSASHVFDTGDTFPVPYCGVSFPQGVEPITRVQLSAIDHASPVSSGSPAHEDFRSVDGGVLVAGSSHQIRVEGTTAGNFVTQVSVYVDWNQDGMFAQGESYQIGTLQNSTGTDGKQAIGMIAVPGAALPGETRMRVLKRYSDAATACNTTGYGQAEDYTVTVLGDAAYHVGGQVTGIGDDGLVLHLNGANPLEVPANGAFAFPVPLATGTSYAVAIASLPTDHACTITNGDGVIAAADVEDVIVTCTAEAPPSSHTVGGRVTGLRGTGLVVQLNGGPTVTMNANGQFVFIDPLPAGGDYAVTIAQQPQGPAQECAVSNGHGTIDDADVRDVTVTCHDDVESLFRDGFELPQ